MKHYTRPWNWQALGNEPLVRIKMTSARNTLSEIAENVNTKFRNALFAQPTFTVFKFLILRTDGENMSGIFHTVQI
jgi:hypothetical protein